jgi:hypothetical protein
MRRAMLVLVATWTAASCIFAGSYGACADAASKDASKRQTLISGKQHPKQLQNQQKVPSKN